MINSEIEKALKDISFQSVSFGYMAVCFYNPEQLAEAQIGYAIDPDGNSLISDEKGSWQESWLVIGHEDLCGDPIFIETAENVCPVYTSMHGAGVWEGRLIANSLQSFIDALKVILELAKGRETPVDLEAHPLPIDERNEALAEIHKLNPGASMSFWENWLNQSE